MNKFIGVGRLTHDPEIRYSQVNNMAIARFSIAIDRRFKKDGEQTADFPNCIAFGKTAEFIEKYFSKGMRIAISGRVQTGSYTNKDGQKVYTTDIVVEECEFCESKGSNQNQQKKEPASQGDGFLEVDEDLPFA